MVLGVLGTWALGLLGTWVLGPWGLGLYGTWCLGHLGSWAIGPSGSWAHLELTTQAMHILCGNYDFIKYTKSILTLESPRLDNNTAVQDQQQLKRQLQLHHFITLCTTLHYNKKSFEQ
jgi:hypothetical protein